MNEDNKNFTGKPEKTGRRNHPHSRIYTKKYADKRQKKNGGLHAMLNKKKVVVQE